MVSRLPFVDGVLIGATLLPLLLLSLIEAFHTAHHRVSTAGAWGVFRAVTMLAPLAAFSAEGRDLRTWVTIQCMSGLMYSAVLLASASRSLRPTTASIRPGRFIADVGAGSLIAIGLLAQAGSVLLDQFLLGVLASDQETAIYSLAATAAFAAVAPVNAMNQMLMPAFLASGEPDGYARRFRIAASFILALAALLALPVWLLVGVIVDLESVSQVGFVNVCLVAAITPRVLMIPNVLRLHHSRRHGTRARIDATSLAINVALNLALIPLLGIWGALLATGVSEAFYGALVLTRTSALSVESDSLDTSENLGSMGSVSVSVKRSHQLGEGSQA